MIEDKIKRRGFLQTSGLSILGAICSSWDSEASTAQIDRPNILWITCEDLSPHLGSYGDKFAYTPNLDKLAAEGVRYEHAYATAPVCTPARSSLITGVFASSLGTQHLRGVMPLAKNIHCFTEFLRKQGYYCSNNVKEDYNFKTPPSAWDESSDTAHWRKKESSQPFFSVFNFMTTHQSRTRYPKEKLEEISQKLPEKERHDPDKVPLPPYYPDTPTIRTNMAVLHTQVTLMDKQVQDILDQLEEDGLAEDTIVFFYSDHGDGLPRGKRWLHDTGIKVPLIIRFPDKYKHLAPDEPGSTVHRMVSFVDFAPTVLSLTGIQPPSYMQGEAFLGEHEGEKRDHIIAISDRVDEVLVMSRTIRNKRYQYIRNFYPHRPRMQKSFFSEITPIRKELRRLDAEGKLEGDEAWLMSPTTPADELYDTQNDPYEMNNLAGSPEHQDIMNEMKQELFDWMIETKDLSLLPESEMIYRSQGGSPCDMAREEGTYPIQRILKIADMVGRGAKYCDEFRKALSDDEIAIRFWAATGLAALGKGAAPALEELQKTLHDPAPSVRYSAAEALCNLDHSKEAVEVLAQGLLNDDVHNQLHASQILLVIGEKAKPAVPEMKKALKMLEGQKDHAWYTRENLSYMLERLV